MPKPPIAIAALGLALHGSVALAQTEGWGTGYQMGTSYAGVTLADGSSLTFYCGAASVRANSVIASGPYLMASLPAARLKVVPSVIEIVVDGTAIRIPVTARSSAELVEFTWKPDRSFGLARMKPVIATLREAKRIELRAANIAAGLPVEGAAKALADDPLRCS